MLEPRDRQMLKEALRPPAGYELDRAISTTFSLDLVAMLSMPVSFTLFDVQDRDGRPTADPLVLLESLRQYAGRITVFCQAGRIAVPRHSDSSFAQLEDSIVEVTPPAENGVFHPKVVVLRFVESSADGAWQADPAERSVRYRFLCSSRNLTFDRSWDTMLVLEGPLNQTRRRAYARNHPLSGFVRELPMLAVRKPSPRIRADMAKLADELLRVEFELPEGFEDLAFHPMGTEAAPAWPFGRDRIDRLLVMAPFVTDGFLNRFHSVRDRRVLVSRPEAMHELDAATLSPFEPFYLDPAVEEEPEAVAADQDSDATPDASASADEEDEANVDELTGLHAKLVVMDRGWKSHIWTGSANATDAALSSNVEFMVELVGSRKRHGVDSLVRPDEPDDRDDLHANVALGNLLQPYIRPEEDVEVNADAREAEQRLQEVRRWLTTLDLSAHVIPTDHKDDADQYGLVVRHESAGADDCPAPATLRCRPVTFPGRHMATVSPPLREQVAAFDPVSFESITSFFVFEVAVSVNAETRREAFVMNLPLSGAPADRHRRLLLSVLHNREQVLRYLLLLLAQDELDVRQIVQPNGSGGSSHDGQDGHGLPLLEPLLKALNRDPRRLDQIARLVEDLSQSEQGRSLLPDNFLQAWEPIWQARKAVTQ